MTKQLEDRNYILQNEEFISFERPEMVDKNGNTMLIMQDTFLIDNLQVLQGNDNYILIVLNGKEEELIKKLKASNIHLKNVIFIRRENIQIPDADIFKEIRRFLDTFGEDDPIHNQLFRSAVKDNTTVLTKLYARSRSCG